MAGRKTLAAVVTGELALLAIVLFWPHLSGLDLDVYRLGAAAYYKLGDPYGALPPTRDGTLLLFTYPPFAALVFGPLPAVPAAVSQALAETVNVLALGAVLAIVFARFERRPPVLAAAVLTAQAAALLSDPVRQTIGYGQVNLVLMLLVVFDLLGPFERRGYLVGIAAAVKLTPLVFVLYFLVRRDFRSAVRAGAAFVLAEGVAWLVAPRAGWHYWTSAVFSDGRIGVAASLRNQSLRGLLERLHAGPVWWPVAAVLTLALTAYAIRRARQPVPAMLVCAIGGLLISPISWTHHWVWLVPAVGVLAWQGRWWAAAPATIVLLANTFWHFDAWPLRECYPLVGLAVLVLLAQPVHDVLDARDQRRDVVRLDGREGADA